MSPPGKRSGFTTNESVVKTMRLAPTFISALSLSRSRIGFESAGRKTVLTNSAGQPSAASMTKHDDLALRSRHGTAK